MERTPRKTLALFAATLFAAPAFALAADAPSPELALSFTPKQKNVVYETPKKADFAKCKVQVERKGKASGWIVVGPGGQKLRRFIDTNGDNIVDQWRYYHHGMEVYRDIDSNFNNKVDQCRWVNSGGSRWGIDSDEDGKIDSWKVISAEEVSQEAVRALATGDAGILRRLLINGDELKSLGVTNAVQRKIIESVSSPSTKLRTVLSKTTVSSSMKWVRFNASQPGTIPADEGTASQDLMVYENAMAIVEADGKPGLVQIGELVQVGKTWKLTSIPQPVGKDVQIAAGGLLMQPDHGGASNTNAVTGSVSPAMQKLLTQLQQLDAAAPKPTDGAKAFADYNARRAALLAKLVAASDNDKDREQWQRQMIDGIAASVQSGASTDGLRQLQAMEKSVQRQNPKSSLMAYVAFRRMLAEYTVRLQKASADKRADVQTWWLKELETFATTYPNSSDAPDAMVQLAMALEFNRKLNDARKWYRKAASVSTSSAASERAAGALRRLDLEGNFLKLSGKRLGGGTVDSSSYRGKVLLVIFWSSWCKNCTDDLPAIRELYRKYQPTGFEIIGVNLDVNATIAKGYVTKQGNSWPHIFEEGGLESRPARQFGLISPPLMFLVDRRGKVISNSVTVDALTKALPGLLKRN